MDHSYLLNAVKDCPGTVLTYVTFVNDSDIGVVCAADIDKTDGLGGIFFYFIRKSDKLCTRMNQKAIEILFRPELSFIKKGEYVLKIRPLSHSIMINVPKRICKYPDTQNKRLITLDGVSVKGTYFPTKNMQVSINGTYKTDPVVLKEDVNKEFLLELYEYVF